MTNSTFSFGDDRVQATLEQRADQLWLTLRDLTAGTTWGSAPLVHVEVYDKAEFRVVTLKKYRIDMVQAVPDGVHVVIGDSFRRLQLGLWLRIEQGELVVTLPVAELAENKAVAYRAFSAIILPGLLQTTGKLVLPLNTGILCNVANKPKVADRFMIYGEQSRWELLPTLPVAAAGALMVLASSGAAETECHVATDGAGSGEVAFGMSFRQFWPDPVELETRVFRYARIPATADPVVFVAKRLRRHVREDFQKPTLRQRMSESPELAYLHDAYIMKLFYAVQQQGIMMPGGPPPGTDIFKQVMSFAEAGALLKKVRAAGIDKVVTQSVGWNPRGHDGLWPTRFPIEERLGGEKGCATRPVTRAARNGSSQKQKRFTARRGRNAVFSTRACRPTQWCRAARSGCCEPANRTGRSRRCWKNACRSGTWRSTACAFTKATAKVGRPR
ncbi:MAG: hypothetical protein WCS70_07785 [Verrucomicrobiota bacterium]